jgi:hypothetical protein
MGPTFSPSRYLTFEGFSVDENGKQHFMDATIAYRQSCLRAIEYLKQFGKIAFISKLLYIADYQVTLVNKSISCCPVRQFEEPLLV